MSEPATQSNLPDGRTFRKGFIYAMLAYVGWGLSPLYWKLLAEVDLFGLVAHRMLWSFVLMFAVARFMRGTELTALFRDKRALLILGVAGVFIAASWWLYIYAVNSNHILQAALGYYINPLMVIIAGVIVFRERLTVPQIIAAILAAIGVLYFTFDYGSFPILSIALAGVFTVYGILKKKGGYPAISALAVETTMVAPVALVFVIASFVMPGNAFLADVSSPESWLTTVLLMGSALVTVLPLLWFAEAVSRLPMSWMGFIQYVSPTVSLILGVFIFGEEFTFAHGVCFGLVWLGLLLISAELVLKQKRQHADDQQKQENL